MAARVQDLLRYGTPVSHTADLERDLQEREWWGRHGRPMGQYRHWRLNEDGLQVTPDVERRGDCRRWVVVGASESYGYFESPGMSWPAQLQRRLDDRGRCVEIGNASIVGMGIAQQVALYQHWLARIHPERVLVYPSPSFYLSNSAPRYPDSAAVSTVSAVWRPRLLERVSDVVEVPAPIQRWRVARWLKAGALRTGAVDRGARLLLLGQHLDSLSAVVRASGSELFVITHATRTGTEHGATKEQATTEQSILQSWRVFCPSVQAAEILQFEADANAMFRRGANDGRWRVLDVAPVLDGRSRLFADMVHFTDSGAGVFAEAVERLLLGSTS